MSTNRKLTKNEKRRIRQKNEKPEEKNGGIVSSSSGMQSDSLGIEIEYVAPDIENLGLDEEALNQFRNVFEKFAKPEDLLSDRPRFSDADSGKDAPQTFAAENAKQVNGSESKTELDDNKLSKKKKKLLSRLSVSELKQLVLRPDVVEAHDVTSLDPRLLIHLKAYRNTVPVPRHWCHVRRYLQGKRGIEKVPYQLPEYIAETGIAKIRETVLEQEAMKKGKQKAREKIRPKMGKIDIDYQVLHDAFFKYQTKPKMTVHGDLYYESKEFEVQAKEKKPGILSSELITALGMVDGAPPPWLINMQRYGPPPSYPNLRIPGLNAPLPPGAAYGYQPGGWGKPPVDEYGRPLYGDVFGVSSTAEVDTGARVDKEFRWGKFEVEEEDLEEEEAEEELEEEEEEAKDDLQTDKTVARSEDLSGLETPLTYDGLRSVVSGMETPVTIDLRKRAGIETPDTTVDHSKNLYQVIKEQKTGAAANQLFTSDRAYIIGKEDSATETSHRSNVEGQDSSFKHLNNFSTDGLETEEDKNKGKKRKAEQTIVSRKVKEFKF